MGELTSGTIHVKGAAAFAEGMKPAMIIWVGFVVVEFAFRRRAEGLLSSPSAW